MPYEPVKRPKRSNKAALRAAVVADPDRLPSKYDPMQRRMKGILRTYDMPFDMPAISQIAPNLWQGGCLAGLVLPQFVKHVVSLFADGTYVISHEVESKLVVKMADKPDEDLSQVDALARWINDCRKTGSVLVYCSAGLNRASVVVARALMLEGMNAQEAIGLIRQKRSPAALCNKHFEKWLLLFE